MSNHQISLRQFDVIILVNHSVIVNTVFSFLFRCILESILTSILTSVLKRSYNYWKNFYTLVKIISENQPLRTKKASVAWQEKLKI